jgi:multidrug resistance efflux pump
MNILGKIFIFAVFVMSLVFMSFAVAIYSSHVNWKEEVERTSAQVQPGKPLGLKYQLENATKEREQLTGEITKLQGQITTAEAKRDQALAKLEYALDEKHKELEGLKKERDEFKAKQDTLIADVMKAQADVKKAMDEAEKLRADIRTQQEKVNEQVNRSVAISAELHEKQSQLAIVNERKTQLEKQLASARMVLKQSGLAIDSLPKDQVPTIDGVVMAVSEGSVEVSIGGDDGLQTGHVLELYRDATYVGRAIVKAVRPDRAVAVMVKEYVREPVQRGDRVTTRLNPA